MQDRKEILNNLIITTNKLKNFNWIDIENINNYKLSTSPQLSIIIRELINGSPLNLNILSDSALLELNITMNIVLNQLIIDKNSGLLNETYFNKHLVKKLTEANSDYQSIYFGTDNKKNSNLKRHIIPKKLIENFTKYRNFNNHPFTKTTGSTFLLSIKSDDYLALIPQYEALRKEEIDEIVKSTNSSISSNNNEKIIYGSFFNNIPKHSPEELLKNIQALETYCKEKYASNLDEMEI